MTAAETQYFALLRAALWNTPFVATESIDWTGVMRIAKHHANQALVGDVALRMTEGGPSAEIRAEMQTSLRSYFIQNIKLRQILIPAVQLLREHGIEPVLLKGFGLALLYPNPNLRQFGDIDLYVGLDHFHEACALLRTLPGGYNWGEEVDAGHHYNIEFGQYPMEIHRVSTEVKDGKEQKAYVAIERDGLVEHARRVDLEGFEISVPSEEFMVFFTFYHAWHHFLTTGVGLRQISDVAMALHAYLSPSDSSQTPPLDLDKLNRWLTEMHLMQPWQTFGCLMVDCLGLPEAEMPFFEASRRRRAQKLYNRIMQEGNFKRDNSFRYNKPNGRVGHKLHTLLCIFGDFFHIAKVFPQQAFRELYTSFRTGLSKTVHAH